MNEYVFFEHLMSVLFFYVRTFYIFETSRDVIPNFVLYVCLGALIVCVAKESNHTRLAFSFLF